MRYVVVAEKPSVARRIREALGGRDIVVTSVRGHLMDSDFPEGYGWGRCRPRELFRVREFVDEVRDRRSLAELRKIFRVCDRLVIATDNDSEGELIGMEILKIWRKVNGNRLYMRMRFNSTDYNELRRAWRSLEETLNWRWVSKALFRQRFDLVTGAAFTRLLTGYARKVDGYDGLVSWGSCQSPTLWFIVQRERERRSFKPRRFWTIKAVLENSRGERFEAESDRFWSRGEAEKMYNEASKATCGLVEGSEEEYENVSRPTPLRTDDMLRDLAKITGLPAARILDIAEDLYAEGYISYPRTDTNRYKPDFDHSQPQRASCKGLGVRVEVAFNPRQGRLDDGAHTPIYPVQPYLGEDVRKTVWEYVARRFLANGFYKDAVRCIRRADVRVGPAVLKASGSHTVESGFYAVYPYFKPEDSPIPSLRMGEELRAVSLKLHEGSTRPAERLTEPELLKILEENGIGTDATRASFPKLILERGYAVKEGKTFKPTELGMRLIELLEGIDEKLVTPDTRRVVEELMAMIDSGGISYDEALEKALREYEKLFIKLEDALSAESRNLLSRGNQL
jgi:DNA topoisomerase IA